MILHFCAFVQRYALGVNNGYIYRAKAQRTKSLGGTGISTIMAALQTAKQIVVVLGAGPGLGFSAAKKFAEQGHPVALLSRSKDNLEPLASQINAQNNGKYGKALTYAVNAQDEPSIRAAIQQISSDFASGKGGSQHQGAHIHTGIFNPGGGFVMSGFLETKPSQVEEAFKTQV